MLPSPLDDLIRLEAEIEKLNRQAALRDAQKKANPAADDMPAVMSIIIDENATARLKYPSGMIRTVRVGDVIGNDDMRVVSITENGVKLQGQGRQAKTTYLPLTQSASQTSSSATPAASVR